MTIKDERRVSRLVLGNVFIVAACAIVYELVTAALASYVLGDAIKQFSITLGLYLAGMGVGAFFSRAVRDSVAVVYLFVELLLALVGGLSAPLLFRIAESGPSFHVIVYTSVTTIGILVGFELPLLMRMLRERSLSVLVARALAWDNAGALVASLLFPIVLVPRLGLMRTSLATGIVNAAVALSGTWILRSKLSSRSANLLRAASGVTTSALVLSFAHASAWALAWAE